MKFILIKKIKRLYITLAYYLYYRYKNWPGKRIGFPFIWSVRNWKNFGPTVDEIVNAEPRLTCIKNQDLPWIKNKGSNDN